MVSSLAKVKERGARVNHSNNDDDDCDDSPGGLVRITDEPKEKWDCESILSEYKVSHQYLLNTQKSISSNHQTPRSGLKKQHAAEVFSALGNQMKHVV